MHFLHKETKSKLRKKIYFFFGKGGGGWGARARVSEFFTKNPNLKKKFFWGEMGLEGGGGGPRVSKKIFTKNPNQKVNFFSLWVGGQIWHIKSVMRHFEISSTSALSECHSYKRILIKEFRSLSQIS